jgi:hypothetical protein
MSSSNFAMLASARYPLESQRVLREDYIHLLQECKSNPAYHARLPTGDLWACNSVPFMPDDNKGWITLKRKIRVKRIKSNEQLDYEAEQMHDYWEAESVDSQSYVLPSGEHNGALFDIGARF